LRMAMVRFGMGRMTSVAVTADLRTVVQARPDGTVALWDVESGERRLVQVGERRVEQLAVSPDGRVILTGGRDGVLHWWEFGTGTNEVRRLEGRQAVFSADSRLLAVLGGTNVVEVWEVHQGSRRASWAFGEALGAAVAFSADGGLLATTSAVEDVENAIHLWDTASGTLVGTFMGHKQPVMSVAFAPDGRTLASSGADGVMKLWNVTARQELLSLRMPGSGAGSLLFSPDGRLLLSVPGPGPGSSRLRLFRAPSFEEIAARSR